ncbi:MAG TPA: glycosyltransferase [Solirubrobacteraceae bacterium]
MTVPSTHAVRVSVVIPCFNYGRYLAEAAESVLTQSLRELELIIVDDGSTDDSRDVARALIAAHPRESIELIAQPNCGVPGAVRNAGIGRARGEYIVCLDADDTLEPYYLEACALALDTNPRAGIAYADLHCFDQDQTINRPPEWDRRTELDANFLGSPSMFRRAAWEQAGGYDETRELVGYEDWDFWVGIVEQGWLGAKAPGVHWNYRVHGGGSIYTTHVQRDRELKARIILKHAAVYSPGQLRWAQAALSGDPSADGAGIKVGHMPAHVAVPRPPQTAVGQTRPIRSICIITKDYPPQVPGGIPRAVQMQAHMLAAAGIQVHVITRSATGQPLVREDAGVLVHEIPEPTVATPGELNYLEIPVWSFTVAAKFAELDATERFDVVETPDYRGEALHLAPRPETALVEWLHTTLMPIWNCEPSYTRTPSDDAWHALEMAALERADLLLAPSQLLLDTTSELLGDRMRPAELMPYLFDAKQFPARPSRPSGAPIRALFYGRLEYRKNPELALHALAAARAAGLDVQLTLLGRDNGSHLERVLRPLQVELGLDDNIEYLAEADVDTVRAILARSDVAILPSRFDNSPLTIFEALSSGVPVITSDRVGTASWIEPENGLLTLAIDDPERFGRQAAEAIADAAWMATGPRAAARMREKFAPEIVTEQLLGCYGRLMAERGVAPYVVQETAAATAPESVVSSDQLAQSAGALARLAAATPAQRLDGARSHAVLGFADEIVNDPSLLAAWAQTFTDADDVTLVIYAPGWSEQDAGARLGAAVEAAGLGAEDAADLMAVATPATPALEAQLAAGASAVLTGRAVRAPFTALPAVGADALSGLRAAAAA